MNEEPCCQEIDGEVESCIQEIDYGGAGVEECCSAKSGYQFRDFSVIKLNYGYNVKVGCHTFAIETPERLIKALTDYITNPSACETSWWKTKTI